MERQWSRAAEGNPSRFTDLKNDEKSYRRLKLPWVLLAELKAQRKTQLAERVQAGPDWAPHEQEGQVYEPVFARRDGRPTGHGTGYRAWKALLKTAKVDDARLHDARRTAATIMLQLGVPARVVTEILGHSTIKLTMDTYSHILTELLADASDQLDTVFG